MFNIFSKIFKSPNEKILQSLSEQVEKVNAYADKMANYSDEELKAQTVKFKEMLANGKTLDDILPEAFATVREVSKRTTGMYHYNVQILGGIVLHQGKIAEMRTGEGKTVVATLPSYLNALTGKGVHVITVNDYLAARDAVWMGQIHHFLGLKVACIQHDKAFAYDDSQTDENLDKERDEKGNFKLEEDYLKPISRREAYQADVLYGTNNEFGFDFLRDNMVYKAEDKVQRELNYTIIDEVDSILIDEARTPLIISSPADQSSEMYTQFDRIAKGLKLNVDYNVDEKMRRVTLTEDGIHNVEKQLNLNNLYTDSGLKMVFHMEQALSANVLYKKDVNYVVKDGEVVIIDEFTGRMMPGRRYSEGLHQAIEAKEKVEIKQESKTLATITFQNLFRMYDKLSGMTGTAATEAEEFSKIYDLGVVVIPTNKPIKRIDHSDNIYRTEMGKYKALIREIKSCHENGQPVLVGTISIEKNELLSQLLDQAGIPHELLNAKNHAREAEIIAQAGRLGAVTVATNMAGRGVDIVLGGNPPSKEEAAKVCEVGGLKVLGTERHESRRIDNQLRGRSGRQGDPGETQFFLSMDDDLMRIFGSDRIKNLMKKMGIAEDQPIKNKLISKSIESAQSKVEGHHFDIRKHLVEYDDVINRHREVVYDLRTKIVALEEDASRAEIIKRIHGVLENLVAVHCNTEKAEDWNTQEIWESVRTIYPVKPEEKSEILGWHERIKKNYLAHEARTDLLEYLQGLADKRYEELEKVLEELFSNLKPLRNLEKQLILRSIDNLWVEHLSAMDYLRTGIGLRGYGQRDPLVEYKREAYTLFTQLLSKINERVVYNIFKVTLSLRDKNKMQGKIKVLGQNPYKKQIENRKKDNKAKSKHAPKKEVGRNDPCPCGSGKKYKKCCGKL